jgi:hypothetical protein
MNSIMKKAVAGLVAGAALVGAVGAPAAEAQRFGGPRYGWHGGYGGYRGHYGYRGWGPGAAVGAGILGLAVGAALATPRYNYGYDYGYAPPPPPPAYGYGYRGYYVPCRPHLIWDPYIGEYVRSRGC